MCKPRPRTGTSPSCTIGHGRRLLKAAARSKRELGLIAVAEDSGPEPTCTNFASAANSDHRADVAPASDEQQS
jgi:hypothetical protein